MRSSSSSMVGPAGRRGSNHTYPLSLLVSAKTCPNGLWGSDCEGSVFSTTSAAAGESGFFSQDYETLAKFVYETNSGALFSFPMGPNAIGAGEALIVFEADPTYAENMTHCAGAIKTLSVAIDVAPNPGANGTYSVTLPATEMNEGGGMNVSLPWPSIGKLYALFEVTGNASENCAVVGTIDLFLVPCTQVWIWNENHYYYFLFIFLLFLKKRKEKKLFFINYK